MFNQFQKFMRLFLFSLLILTFSIIGFNFFIDPFKTFDTKKVERINQIKVEVEHHARLYKALDIIRQKPKAIIIGSSRVMAGFNPDHLTEIIGEYTYNAGLSGAGFEEIFHYIEHVIQNF